jgi:predicted nucleotidyltransferase component of viral defense system
VCRLDWWIQEEIAARRELVTSEYDDVCPFVVTVLTAEHLMAEKIRTMLVRGKPRDLYDIWLLLNQGMTALKKGQKGTVRCVCAKHTHNAQYPTDLFAVESRDPIGHSADRPQVGSVWDELGSR